MSFILNSLQRWPSLATTRHWFPRLMTARQMCGKNMANDAGEDKVTNFADNDDEEVVKNERIFAEVNAKQYECLATDSDQLRTISGILSTYEYLKYSTSEVPTQLTTDHMRHLLQLKSRNQRNKYLNYLYKKEIREMVSNRMRSREKIDKKKQLTDRWHDMGANRTGIFDDNGNIVYGLWHNTLFTRISPQNTRHQTQHRLRNASLFGQNIVFDMTADPQITVSNCLTKLRQLVNSYQVNRYHFNEPFNLHFCNVDQNSDIWRTIQQKSSEFTKFPYFLSAFTSKSYLDLFNPRDVIYLSLRADQQLLDYESDKIYVIGFGDDFSSKDKLRYKLRSEKIQFRRLPLDKFVQWSGPTKDLKSAIVLNILNDIRDGQQWREAFERNLPKGFIKSQDVIEKENLYIMEKIKKRLKISNNLRLEL
ncbi:mitochondrial ribonuclease P protein 1 homolog [Oppia nitens]|uniref:mitochondrial ribonuclease P protein 1 homolog n=1 Tax=Oppia nitens TaxID=1686743 RepID=UPI0023DA3327|nr:mitochondrial ribonuclease P protein 1 homolog [Oppia nitens]